MLKFKKITKEDFSTIDKYFDLHLKNQTENSVRFCDYAPGTIKMWHEAYLMEYAVYNDVMFLRANYEEESGTSYLMPVGNTDESSLRMLAEYVATVPEATLSVIPEGLKKSVSEIFNVEEDRIFFDRDWCDYLYIREAFCNPFGKKYHNYKYNLNRFKRDNPDYVVEPLCKENADEALSFYKRYCKNNPFSSSVDDAEYLATLPVIEYPQLYSMSGAVLKINGTVVGLTIGEIYGDTVIVHTEKAEKDIGGAYQTLAREYQLMMPKSVKYINREEDMGLEGLRRSKHSYVPHRLENKYTLNLK